MPKQKSPQRGGARAGAGRKSAKELGLPKKQTYQVYLYPVDKEKLMHRHGSLTKAIESLL